ncbi:MAG: NYN domain-containing protein [Anaerolineales bacterium]|jgi:uncharacterized LabA/DUF88 family protein
MALRTRVFIDFWNFQLSLNANASPGYRLDWKALSPWLVAQAEAAVTTPLAYEGTHVYVSSDPASKAEAGLRDFALNVLDRFPGVNVTLIDRKPRNPPTCPTCHQPITSCPHCNGPMNRTIEKGVDTAIVTDIFKLVWENVLEVIVLVSSDRDYIPAVEMLSAKGYRVINAHFPPLGMHLARTCWASIDVKNGLSVLERKRPT